MPRRSSRTVKIPPAKSRPNAAKRRVAIFDIDGTIFRSSLLVEVTEALIQKKLFPAAARRYYTAAHEAWMNRQGSYEDYIMSVVHAFEKYIPGIHYSQFLDVAEEVVAARKDRVYRYTRDLVFDLKRRGYFLLAISLSPKSIVEKFAKQLGFDKVYGLLYKQNAEGLYEHGLQSSDILADKGAILLRAVQKENLTLAGSIGVGDTEGDIKFLKLVVKPICFNPNSVLFAHAKKAGWKVVVERKDDNYTVQ